jgi:hypothetical protein
MTRLATALVALMMLSAPVAPADLDRLLGPVALYPDALLGQMLLCAANPGKVGALDEWLASRPNVKGTELQDAAKQSGFEDSFVSLTMFPDVVHWMAGDVAWTTKIGQAFSTDRSAVFASIQRLRSKAKAAGTLKSTPQQTVQTQTSESGQTVIVIEPANPQIVYVPQYNADVVYTQPTSTTVVVEQSSSSGAVAAGVIGFTAGIAIGAAFDNDYYYGPYGWGGGYRMYDDAWDDWYDARDDARDDWQDHREDLADERGDRAEERGDRARTTQEQRTERQETRVENRPTTQSRGHSGERAQAATSGASSDAFSNYSSGKSERAASQRGKSSRSSSGGARKSGGGRRR